MKFSLSGLAKLPSLSKLETFASSLVNAGVLGIDIGGSSAKIVQLTLEGTEVTLGTYGEISLGMYGDRDAGKGVLLAPAKAADAVLDALHAVDAHARRGGFALPVGSTFISVIELPKRDQGQLEKILPAEAKQYIPVPIESVILNWVIIDEDAPAGSAIERMEAKRPVQRLKQRVMFIATDKATADAHTDIAATAGIKLDFLEVELFSAARACKSDMRGPALIMDLGASSTKLYAINGAGVAVATHTIPFGGQAMTESLMAAASMSFEQAEELKCRRGLDVPEDVPPQESAMIISAIEEVLLKIFRDASKFIKELSNGDIMDAQRVVMIGGGACMPRIAEVAKDHFKIDAVLGQPFSHVHAPVLLEDVLKEVGPKYAVALGLALRALGK